MTPFAEAEVEQAALDWLEGLGWQATHRPTSQRDALLSRLVSGDV